jgi:4-amino-4-deoxy-L-arabinose transferase-like glycosyltransferase
VVSGALRGPERFFAEGYTLFFTLARQLAEGHGYAFPGQAPTAFRVPLYPLFLAALTGGEADYAPVLAAQALVSTGTVVLAGLMAREWFGPRSGLIAAALCAVYPYYVLHDVTQQETVLFTFLAGLATWLALVARRRGSIPLAGLAGLALGAAILTRATLAPFALFAAAWLMLPRTCRGAGMGLACLAATLLTLSPWLVRAHDLTGRWTLGTEFGAAVYAGNHPLTFSHYPRESIDRSREAIFGSLGPAQRAELAPLDEPAQSDWYLARGVDWIADHPGAARGGGLRKLAAVFGPLPVPRHGLLGNAVHALSFFPVLVLALAMLWRRRELWRVDALIHGHLVLFCAITAVLWAQTSHRSYLDLYLIVFAAGALEQLSWRARRVAQNSRAKRAELS